MAILNTNEAGVAHMVPAAFAADAAYDGGEPSDVTVKLGKHEYVIDKVELKDNMPEPDNTLDI
ncbi:MAG: hypothetical protein AB8B83_04625 [Bdellovibrionales bacterium]